MRWLLICLLLPVVANGTTQNLSSDAGLKAAFIYRFAQFTKWPDERKTSLSYCVYNDDKVFAALQKVLNNSNSQVHLLSTKHEYTQCDVLYFATEAHQASALLNKRDNQAVLTIAENMQTFRQGMIIGFIAEPKRLSFRVNLQAAQQQGLTLSSQMLKLAKEIH